MSIFFITLVILAYLIGVANGGRVQAKDYEALKGSEE